MNTFQISLADLQPSQLYISADKLTEVERSRDATPDADADPLPVARLGSRIVLTDGHTRAAALCRGGVRSVRVAWETDALDWEAYEACVRWCLDEGVRTVADLLTRVVAADRYEQLWIGRCRALHDRLARQRAERADGRTGRAAITTQRLELVAADGWWPYFVLRTCGFEPLGDGSEPGVIRFELMRDGASRGRGGA
jgi:hypothetical protein